MDFLRKIRQTNLYDYVLMFIVFPFVIGISASILSYFSIIFVKLFSLDFLDNNKEIFLGWFSLLGVYYTFYFKKKDDENKKIEADLNNFALIEPIPIYKEAFMHKDIKIENNQENNTESNNENCVDIISNGRVFSLSCIEPFNNYKKYVNFPFKEKKSALFSVINKGKNYGIPKYVYILFNKKEDEVSHKRVYIKSHDIHYTIHEIPDMSYMFPFKESNQSGHITMTPEEKYEKFYKHFVDNENDNDFFIVVIEYKSVINNRKIIQAYKAKMVKYNDKFYIDVFNPMKKEEIEMDIEKDFANEIIEYSIYKD